ncbi:MAG TPA: hypothetical protein PLC05_02475, partial [bacterium]|nr:hypothetical protein [bacterium]
MLILKPTRVVLAPARTVKGLSLRGSSRFRSNSKGCNGRHFLSFEERSDENYRPLTLQLTPV